jgi:hypothetical protein
MVSPLRLDGQATRQLTSPKPKRRVPSGEFRIIGVDEYDLLKTLSYTVKQLKEIARAYSLRVSGARAELQARIYGHLRDSSSARAIQRCWRGYIARTCARLRGPGLMRRSDCINETDFFSMAPLVDVPADAFASYRCPVDGKVYGFDIVSLERLLAQKGACNPYTREPLPEGLVKDLGRLRRLLAAGGGTASPSSAPPDVIDPDKALEFSAISVFHAIDELGNISNYDWFWALRRVQLIRFIREMADIWGYRAQLPASTKRQVCPPEGNPFLGIGLQYLPALQMHDLRRAGLEVMDRMVTLGVDESARSLGANYVLCALTLVSPPAASAFPWLYDAVAGV